MTLLPASLRLLFFVVPALAQTGTPAPESAPGMVALHNQALRLTYSVPSNYVDAAALVGPALQASLGGGTVDADAARCLSLPVARMAPPQGQQGISMVLLVRADGGCFKKRFDAKSVAELTEGEARGVTASGAKAHFGEVRSFTLAGRAASILGGSFALPTGQTLQTRVLCILDQPDIACWQFLASEAAALDTMSHFPVTFEGGEATPLTPPKP